MVSSPELNHLSTMLGFSLAELELNRLGQLSDAQNGVSIRDLTMGLGMIFVALGALFLILGIKTTTLLRVLWCVFLIPGCGVMLYFGFSLFRGGTQKKVVSAEGFPTFAGGSRGPPSLVIGVARVSAPKNAMEALSKEERYRVYYVERTGQFLSIEPL